MLLPKGNEKSFWKDTERILIGVVPTKELVGTPYQTLIDSWKGHYPKNYFYWAKINLKICLFGNPIAIEGASFQNYKKKFPPEQLLTILPSWPINMKNYIMSNEKLF